VFVGLPDRRTRSPYPIAVPDTARRGRSSPVATWARLREPPTRPGCGWAWT